ncbi:MAG: PucR family transcriptional regulator [Pseudomonadota bacterium]
MTKVITRYFDSEARAREVVRELAFRRISRRIIRVFTEAEGLVDTLTGAHVTPATAEAYHWRMAEGGAVVLVNAGIKPLGVAQTTREVMSSMGAVDLGNLTEEVVVADPPVRKLSVMAEHPLLMTRERDPESTNYHMANWPIPLISRRTPNRRSLIAPHARMADWPLRHILRTRPRDEFIFPRHARMANLIFPLTIRRNPSDTFAFPRHARMANWPVPLTNRRKPFTGSWIGRHARLANWPFPYLINGQTGTNALIPGGPRMANFILPLLSRRKPVDAFAFPRHARMANLALPLLSGRKPMTASIFPRHARMADMILPLVVRRDPKAPAKGGSLSRLLDWPTLSRK